MIAIFQLLSGTLQLLLGRKIFWLMVGIMGFLLGLFLTMYILDLPVWMKLLLGLGVGILFSLLAVFIQKPMAAIFGFIAFGLAGTTLARILGLVKESPWFLIVFVVAGLIGAALVLSLFEWALIIGTSFSGSGSIITGLESLIKFSENGLLLLLIFFVLSVVGIIYQSKYLNLQARK